MCPVASFCCLPAAKFNLTLREEREVSNLVCRFNDIFDKVHLQYVVYNLKVSYGGVRDHLKFLAKNFKSDPTKIDNMHYSHQGIHIFKLNYRYSSLHKSPRYKPHISNLIYQI